MSISNRQPFKRHCMVVYAIYPLGETRVQREAEALLRSGYAVDVLCVRAPGEPALDDHNGVRIFRLPFRFPLPIGKSGGLIERFLSYIWFCLVAGIRLTGLHLKNHYGSVQVHNLPDFLAFSALIPKLLGVPVILDLHDLMPEFFAGRFGQKGWANRIIRLQERLACRFADHVITVSEHWKQALIQRGVPAQKISVVMNVADANIFHPSQDSRPLPGEKDGFKLIYHGTLPERYGLDLAIRAVDQLRQEIPGIHLTLIGKGDYKTALVKQVQDLGLQGYVTFDALHLAEELPEIILSHHLGVVPYRNDVFTDGLLPTKLLEYAALGMPAVASRTTAIYRYFQDTNVAFFEPGSADDLARCIRTLYQHPDQLTELAHGSQKFNQQYSWPRVSAEYIDLVDRLRTRRAAAQPAVMRQGQR